jgi:hypothetical protein
MAQTPCASLGDYSKVLYLLSFSSSFKSSERIPLLAPLAATFKHFQVLEVFDSMHSCSNSPSTLAQVFNPKLHLACALLAWLLCLSALWVNENKSYLYLNPLSMHSLQTLQLHSLHESSGSNRETIETHSFFPSDFKLKHEIIHTAYKSKCIIGSKHS